MVNTDENKQQEELAQLSEKLFRGKQTLAEARGIPRESLDHLYNLAIRHYYEQKKFQDAQDTLELLCLHSHMESRYWYALGYCRKSLGNHASAATALALGIQHDDNPPADVYLNLATCLMETGDQVSARACLEAVPADAGVRPQAESMLAVLDGNDRSQKS